MCEPAEPEVEVIEDSKDVVSTVVVVKGVFELVDGDFNVPEVVVKSVVCWGVSVAVEVSVSTSAGVDVVSVLVSTEVVVSISVVVPSDVESAVVVEVCWVVVVSSVVVVGA